jgi:ABC-type nitrate/sulfonate/bicarbonate transport system substrate-binding protein
MSALSSGRNRTLVKTFAFGAVIAVAVAGCSSSGGGSGGTTPAGTTPAGGASTSSSAPVSITTVTYGTTAPVASYLPIWMAQEVPSICAPFGIKVKTVALNHDAGITAAISKSVDFSETSDGSILQAGVKASKSIVAIALTGPKASGIFGAADIKTLADFKGKTLSATSIGSTSDIHIRLAMKDAGLSRNDYKVVYTTSQQAMTSLAVTGHASGFPLVPPLPPAIDGHGFHQLQGNPPAGTPDALVSADGIITNPDWAKSHASVVTGLIKCMDAAVTYLNDDSHASERDAALVKYVGIKQADAESTYQINKGAYLPIAPFDITAANTIISTLTDIGIYTSDTFKGFDVNSLLDTSYMPAS